MSLVTEILSSAGSLAKEDLHTKISKLSQRTHDVKRELYDLVKESFCDFTSTLTNADEINSQISEIQVEVTTLQRTFDAAVTSQIDEASDESSYLVKEYKKAKQLVTVLGDLNSIYASLEEISCDITAGDIQSTAGIIHQVERKLELMEGSVLASTQIFIQLKQRIAFDKIALVDQLNEIWDNSILWTSCKDNEDDLDEGEEEVKLRIKSDGDDLCSISGMVEGLKVCGMLERKIVDFAQICFTDFISKLIKDRNQYVSVNSTGDGKAKEETISLLLQVEDKPKSDESDFSDDDSDDNDALEEPISPANVFAQLKQFLTFLNDNLLTLGNSLMAEFSKSIQEDTIELLISDCLSKSIPNTKEELHKYEQIKILVVEFENFLKEISFLPKTTEPGKLVNYASDIHIHYSKRSSNNLVLQARKLMKMDLHQTVEVNGKSDSVNKIWSNRMMQNTDQPRLDLVKREHQVKEITNLKKFQLPRMKISVGAKQIVELTLQVLNQAGQEELENSLRLYETAKNIIQLYIVIVPTYHKESIMKLPQVSAIHYNDCYYISHHLLEASYFQSAMQSEWKLQQIWTLLDSGCNCLLDQVSRQQDSLFDSLSPLKTLNNVEEKYEIADKPIKQVLHQLQYLRRVWFKYLPLEILLKSLYTLVDAVLSELTLSICALEDMTSDDSIHLRTSCGNLQDKICNLFEQCYENSAESKDLTWQRNLTKWQQMKELIFILDASLMDIVDRWADGKGPLAITFTSSEVRSLIRALFQNTDRRSNAISKIRY